MKRSTLIDNLLIDCSEIMRSIYLDSWVKLRENFIKSVFQNIKSEHPDIFMYICNAFNRLFELDTPEHLAVFLEYRLQILLKQNLSDEEIQALIIFNHVLLKAIYAQDYEYFKLIFTCECSAEAMGEILIKCASLGRPLLGLD